MSPTRWFAHKSSMLMLAAAGLVACSKASPAEKAGTTGGIQGQRYEDVVIKFSDPGNAGVLAYAKREGVLERELAKVNAKIEWIPGVGAFSASVEAMNAGAINASGAAVSPVIGALSHNLQFKIFAIGNPGGVRQAGIIAPAESTLRTVKDLSGKRVAVNSAAHGDYILLRALAKNDVPAHLVTRLPIQPPDAAAAFATGKVDAWSTFGTFFSSAVRNGAHVLTLESEIESDDVGVNAANVAVLRKNPFAFQVFLKVMQDLTEEAHRSPEKFQNVFTDKGPTAVSGDNLRLAIEETKTLPIPRVPTADDKRRIGNVIELFFENQSIDRRIPVDDVVFDIDQAARAKDAP